MGGGHSGGGIGTGTGTGTGTGGGLFGGFTGWNSGSSTSGIGSGFMGSSGRNRTISGPGGGLLSGGNGSNNSGASNNNHHITRLDGLISNGSGSGIGGSGGNGGQAIGGPSLPHPNSFSSSLGSGSLSTSHSSGPSSFIDSMLPLPFSGLISYPLKRLVTMPGRQGRPIVALCFMATFGFLIYNFTYPLSLSSISPESLDRQDLLYRSNNLNASSLNTAGRRPMPNFDFDSTTKPDIGSGGDSDEEDLEWLKVESDTELDEDDSEGGSEIDGLETDDLMEDEENEEQDEDSILNSSSSGAENSRSESSSPPLLAPLHQSTTSTGGVGTAKNRLPVIPNLTRAILPFSCTPCPTSTSLYPSTLVPVDWCPAVSADSEAEVKSAVDRSPTCAKYSAFVNPDLLSESSPTTTTSTSTSSPPTENSGGAARREKIFEPGFLERSILFEGSGNEIRRVLKRAVKSSLFRRKRIADREKNSAAAAAAAAAQGLSSGMTAETVKEEEEAAYEDEVPFRILVLGGSVSNCRGVDRKSACWHARVHRWFQRNLPLESDPIITQSEYSNSFLYPNLVIPTEVQQPQRMDTNVEQHDLTPLNYSPTFSSSSPIPFVSCPPTAPRSGSTPDLDLPIRMLSNAEEGSSDPSTPSTTTGEEFVREDSHRIVRDRMRRALTNRRSSTTAITTLSRRDSQHLDDDQLEVYSSSHPEGRGMGNVAKSNWRQKPSDSSSNHQPNPGTLAWKRQLADVDEKQRRRKEKAMNGAKGMVRKVVPAPPQNKGNKASARKSRKGAKAVTKGQRRVPITRLIDGSKSATGSAFYTYCFQEEMTVRRKNIEWGKGPDLILLEFGVNDVWPTGEVAIRDFEKLLRQLRSMPSNPAIVILEAASLLLAQTTATTSTAEYLHLPAAQFYDVPILSAKQALFGPTPSLNPNSSTKMEDLFLPDLHHPNEKGHELLSDILIHYLERQACGVQEEVMTAADLRLFYGGNSERRTAALADGQFMVDPEKDVGLRKDEDVKFLPYRSLFDKYDSRTDKQGGSNPSGGKFYDVPKPHCLQVGLASQLATVAKPVRNNGWTSFAWARDKQYLIAERPGSVVTFEVMVGMGGTVMVDWLRSRFYELGDVLVYLDGHKKKSATLAGYWDLGWSIGVPTEIFKKVKPGIHTVSFELLGPSKSSHPDKKTHFRLIGVIGT